MRMDNPLTGNAHPGHSGFDDWLATVRSVDMVNPGFMYDSSIDDQKVCGDIPGASAQIMMASASNLPTECGASAAP